MEYIALGSMSGTSLDGIDLSIIKSNGLDSFQEIDNLFEPYSADLKTEIHRVITDGYLLNPNLPNLISNEYLNSIDKIYFLTYFLFLFFTFVFSFSGNFLTFFMI